MTTESATPESGPLSVEQAIASLVEPPPEAQETPEAAPDEAAPEVEESEAETTPAEETASEAEEPGDGEKEAEASEPEAPEVEAPAWWKAEHKARFKELPPDVQAVVLEQEQTRERLVSEAKERASTAEKQRDEELKGVRTLAEQLNAFLPDALQTFQQRWGQQEPDWVQVQAQYGADEAFKLKSQFEAEGKKLQQLQFATQTAQAEAHKAFVQSEWKALAQIEPELAPDPSDPAKGAETRQKVTGWLVSRGIPQGAIAQISAAELSIAYDAMRWREAQAAVKAAPKPKPAASAIKAPVRPAAAQAQPSSQRTATAVAQRFGQDPSVDNAVALLVSRQGINQ